MQDGGSTDGTHDILRRYPTRWAVARDTGPHDAVNKAILATTGDVIVIMPANDTFAPGAFSRAAAEFQSRPEFAMVYGDCQFLAEDGAVCRIDRPGPLDIDGLFWGHWLMLQSAYLRREMFHRVGLFDPAIKGPGDTDWVMRMVALYPLQEMGYVPEVWSSYRYGQSLKGVSFSDCSQNARVLFAAHERFLAQPENRRRLRRGEARAHAGMHCQAAFWCAQAGQHRQTWDHYFEALRQWPGLMLTRTGASYSVKIFLGPKLARTCSRFAIKAGKVQRGFCAVAR